MGYVEIMIEMLESMPRRKGLGQARKLDMLETTDQLMSDTKKRIADYHIRTKDSPPGDNGNIDDLIGDCTLDAVKILLVLCQQRTDWILNLAKYLSEAQRQIWERRRKETQ